MRPIHLTIRPVETGNRIRLLLREHGYTVRDVQTVMGFTSTQAVYKWLAGRSLPNIENLLILSRILETNVEGILVVDETPDAPDDAAA